MINPMPGVTWRDDLVTASEDLPFDVESVMRDHLRVISDGEEEYIGDLIRAAMADGENQTGRSFLPQTRRLSLDAFPASGDVILMRPPVIEIESFAYVDGDGETVVIVDGTDYQAAIPFGPKAGYARLRAYPNTSWASTRTQMDAIQITYRAGYVTGGSPEQANIPWDLKHAMLLMVGELYRQRSLGVQGTTIVPAIIQARNIYASYRPY